MAPDRQPLNIGEMKMANAYQKFQAVEKDINGLIAERQDIVRALSVGLISKSHVFLLGPAGTGKSYVVNEYTQRVMLAKQFVRLLTKFSTPEEIIGAISLKGLEEDRFERVFTGYLPEAHIAFLDEIFKANSAILNSLLTIMNERLIDNGASRVKVPLQLLVGASNEVPQDDSLGALYDRFMLRYETKYISDGNLLGLMLGNSYTPSNATLDLQDIETAQAEARLVDIPSEVGEGIISLKSACAREGFTASDRRWMGSVPVLKAVAYLDGRDKVKEDDLLIYSAILWNDPKDRRKLNNLVSTFVNPDLAKIEQISDAIDQLLAELRASGGGENKAIEFAAKLGEHKEKLRKLNGGEKGKQIKESIDSKWKAALKGTLLK
jgi:MoxR-like ATPase